LERKNLWAPWRIKYIKGLSEDSECFICDYLKRPDDDHENLVLWRTEHCIVTFNKFPYNNGHLLVAPVRHIGNLDDASDEELLELSKLTRDCQRAPITQVQTNATRFLMLNIIGIPSRQKIKRQKITAAKLTFH